MARKAQAKAKLAFVTKLTGDASCPGQQLFKHTHKQYSHYDRTFVMMVQFCWLRTCSWCPLCCRHWQL
jgi:hypothetical protein